MAGFDDEKTDPNGPSPSGPSPNGPPELIPQAETTEDDFYALAEPEPDAPAPGAGVTRPEWYVAVSGGGRKEGPMGLMELQQRVASGRLRADMLVWKSGMPDWIPAGGVPELFDPSAPPPVPPTGGSAGGSFGGSSADAAAKAAEMLGWLDGLFASPGVYRITGRVCAALGAAILLVAMILLPFNLAGSAISLTVSLLCALIFLIGEAAGAILHVLGRIESQSAAPPQSDDPPS